MGDRGVLVVFGGPNSQSPAQASTSPLTSA